MSSGKDYYQILGVMPDAEAVVITAAYRALASLYHPDRWKGDKTFATNKMADINVAYDTLSNPVKRAEYNKNRTNSYSSFSDDSEETEMHFGTNKRIILFAQYLISKGHKKAIVSLNQYVDVLGSSINPQLIIDKISVELKFNFLKIQQVDGEPLRKLQQTLLKYKSLDNALDLITASGFIAVGSSSFFEANTKFEIFMKDSNSDENHFLEKNLTEKELIDWCCKNLC